jgi:hypothetical protein
MPTTAWRFVGTEGADEAVLKLKQLEAAKLVEVQDVTVIRWPQYAAGPTVQEHVTEEGSKVSSLMHKFTHTGSGSRRLRGGVRRTGRGTNPLRPLGQEQDEVRAALGNSGVADQSQ